MIVKRFFIFLFIIYHGISFSEYTALLEKERKYRTLPPSLASKEHHHTKHLTAVLLPKFSSNQLLNAKLNKKFEDQNFTQQKESAALSIFLQKKIPKVREYRFWQSGQFHRLPTEMIVKIAEHTIKCDTFYKAITGFRSFAYLLKARAGIDLMDPASEEHTKSLRDHFTAIFLHRFPSIHPLVLYKNLKINISEELSKELLDKSREPLQQVIDDIAKKNNIKQEAIDQWFANRVAMEKVTPIITDYDIANGKTLLDVQRWNIIKKSIEQKDQIPLLAFFKNKKISQTLAQSMLKSAMQDRYDLSDIIRLCLAAGADPSPDIVRYCTYLKWNLETVLKLLLKAGADPDQDGLFEHAIYYDNIAAVKLLLDAGANPNSTKNTLFPSRQSPLSLAIKHERTAILQLLLQAGANPKQKNYLHRAIKNRKTKQVKYLLEFGADPNTLNKKEESPLLLAIQKRDIEIVKLLLDAGAKPNQNFSKDIMVLFKDAIFFNKIEQVKYLLEFGADPNTLNTEGELPLLLAIQRRNIGIVKLLLEAGANPNQPGKTLEHIDPTLIEGSVLLPLACAIERQHIEIIKLLLKYGADPYLTNTYLTNADENINAFEHAQSTGNKEIINLLKPYKPTIFQTILCFLGIHKNIKL